jgi:hypothetical protein
MEVYIVHSNVRFWCAKREADNTVRDFDVGSQHGTINKLGPDFI